jgi:hypothetical protein
MTAKVKGEMKKELMHRSSQRQKASQVDYSYSKLKDVLFSMVQKPDIYTLYTVFPDDAHMISKHRHLYLPPSVDKAVESDEVVPYFQPP